MSVVEFLVLGAGGGGGALGNRDFQWEPQTGNPKNIVRNIIEYKEPGS